MGKRHSGYQVPGGTLFQRIFLMVRGRSEISAEKVYLQVPGTQSAVFPFIYIGTQGASRYLVPRVPFSHSFTLVPRVPPYTTYPFYAFQFNICLNQTCIYFYFFQFMFSYRPQLRTELLKKKKGYLILWTSCTSIIFINFAVIAGLDTKENVKIGCLGLISRII